MQLPFIIISSGISSGVYLLFLFLNIGQAKDHLSLAVENIDHNIELSVQSIDLISDSEINLLDFYSDNLITDTYSFSFNPAIYVKKKPKRYRSFKFTYSLQFANASYSRPHLLVKISVLHYFLS